MIRRASVLFTLLGLLACQSPTALLSEKKKVALVLDMDGAAPALSPDQRRAVEQAYREALKARLQPYAEVLEGPAADEDTPEVQVTIEALTPPVLEEGLLKDWVDDTMMDAIVAPLLASKGIQAGHQDHEDVLVRSVRREVERHRLKRLGYRPFILVGTVSFLDKEHVYEEDLDGWKLLALMNPLSTAVAHQDESLPIRREEGRALAEDVMRRLGTRANWGVALRHQPPTPAWFTKLTGSGQPAPSGDPGAGE